MIAAFTISTVLLAAGAGPCPTPPPGVTDLEVESSTATSVTLAWHAPVIWDTSLDDLLVATSYDLRYLDADPYSYPEDWFEAATPVPILPPGGAGSPEHCTIEGLTPNTDYWFRILTYYGPAPEPGGFSPYAQGSTGADTVAPDPVVTLHVVATGTGSVTLSWTAPGDRETPGQTVPGPVAHYLLKYSDQHAIANAGDWGGATPFDPSLAWTPATPGQPEPNRVVTGLDAGRTYWFMVKSFDHVQTPSALGNSVSASIPLPVVELLEEGGDSKCLFGGAGVGAISTLALLGLLVAVSRR